jgi:hypothetical protein
VSFNDSPLLDLLIIVRKLGILMMSENLAVKQKLLDKIASLSEDQIINVLEFVNSLAKFKDRSENVIYKPWQPSDPYDAIEKLTNLLETDKLNDIQIS